MFSVFIAFWSTSEPTLRLLLLPFSSRQGNWNKIKTCFLRVEVVLVGFICLNLLSIHLVVNRSILHVYKTSMLSTRNVCILTNPLCLEHVPFVDLQTLYVANMNVLYNIQNLYVTNIGSLLWRKNFLTLKYASVLCLFFFHSSQIHHYHQRHNST